MLHYAIIFFVIALVATVLGFSQVAGLSCSIDYLFAVLAVIFLAVSLLTRVDRRDHAKDLRRRGFRRIL